MAAEAMLQALRHVWKALETLGLPMAVMGGIALAAWKHVRATRDVDLLVSIGSLGTDAILARLAESGVYPKREPPVLALGQLRIIQLLYEPSDAYVDVQIDLLIAESDYHREALARRVATHLPGLDTEISILACEDLILHKLLAGRIIDKADVVALLRANRASLEVPYLLRWTHQLGLDTDLAEAWDEAFPGDPLPAVGS